MYDNVTYGFFKGVISCVYRTEEEDKIPLYSNVSRAAFNLLSYDEFTITCSNANTSSQNGVCVP